MRTAFSRACQSGRGLPQSKTWRRLERVGRRGSVLECASLLALFLLWPTVGSAQFTEEIPPLQPIRAELPPTFWEQHALGIVVYSVQAVLVLAFILWLVFKRRRPVMVPIETQTRRELEALRAAPVTGETLSRISRCLRRYFGAAFQLPPGEHTTTDFCAMLEQQSHIGSGLAEETADFLRETDVAKFAPGGAVEREDAVRRAMQLVDAAERRREALRQAERATPQQAGT
jgi:hypothetical protein